MPFCRPLPLSPLRFSVDPFGDRVVFSCRFYGVSAVALTYYLLIYINPDISLERRRTFSSFLSPSQPHSPSALPPFDRCRSIRGLLFLSIAPSAHPPSLSSPTLQLRSRRLSCDVFAHLRAPAPGLGPRCGGSGAGGRRAGGGEAYDYKESVTAVLTMAQNLSFNA